MRYKGNKKGEARFSWWEVGGGGEIIHKRQPFIILMSLTNALEVVFEYYFPVLFASYLWLIFQLHI